MVDPVPILSRKRDECQRALLSYIQSASLIPVFGDPTIEYRTDWKVRLGDRARPRHTILFPFSGLYGDLGEYLRAFISHTQASNGMKPHAGSQYFRVAGFLSQAMAERRCDSVIDIGPAILSRAQQLVEQYGYAHGSVVDHCNKLQKFGRDLVYSKICLIEFDWSHPHRSQGSPDVFSQEARAKEKGLLPQESALRAHADLRPLIEKELRAGSARARFDLIIYWITIVVFATGLRVTDVISNERDFLIRRIIVDQDGRERAVYLLRRSTSKGGPSDARPLSPTAALLCRRAKKYLHVLTRDSRQVLADYVATGDVAPEWKDERSQPLTQSDVSRYLGLASAQSRRRLMDQVAPGRDFHLDDLRTYLNTIQEKFLQGIERADLNRRYYPVMTTWVGRNGRKLAGRVVRMIDYADVRNFLAGNSREMQPASARYLGEAYRLASHQFRRLMDTSLREGGISENELAVIQGRANPAQNAVYDYRTPDERAHDVREAIRNGEGYGWAASTYWSLPIDDRDEFLESVIQVAYRTAVGHCITNITENSCPFHLQCLSGCGDYLHVKGDRLALEGLSNHKTWANHALSRLDEAEASDPEFIDGAQNHRSHISRQLKTIERVMAIEHDPDVAAGESVRVNPNNESYAADAEEW